MARRHVGTLPLGGMIALCAILLFAPQARSQTIKRKTFTISGSVGLAGVTLKGLPGSVQTDENGVYSAQVDYGWTGKVQPVKTGYVFQPPETAYNTKVTANLSDQDYVATRVKFTISGSVGLPGVVMNGFPTDVTSDETGRYTATVDYDWSGTVTPQKAGYRFEPVSRPYANVTKSSQDSYQQFEVKFTISGTAERAGITMKGLPGDPVTGADGTYKAEVPYEWSGTVVPTRDGCLFTPDKREYVMVTSSQANENYETTVLSYPISGSVGMEGVVLKGLPGDVVSDASGFYMASVEHGWSGTVTPEKPGWTFTPPSIDHKAVTAAKENQNYNSTEIFLKIEGKTGVGQVTLAGFPGGSVTSSEAGLYSAQVPYNWNGTVVPDKPGFSFTPKERPYSGVTANQSDQSYKAEKVTFEISGNVQLPGVSLEGFPVKVTSKTDGSYSVKVDYNWTGKVTPKKGGYEFDPPVREYPEVYLPLASQDYLARTIQYAISGKVLDKKSSAPISGVEIVAEGTSPVTSAITDQDGFFELKVDHNWRGKITPQLAGYNFTPPGKPIDPVTGPLPNQAITGEIKMLTISNVIKFDDKEPIQDVRVTAEPNENTVPSVTDATGRYNVKVPYGWSGSLNFYREDLEFDVDASFLNVIEDLDLTAPKRTPAPPVEQTSKPAETDQTTPKPAGTGQTTPKPAGTGQTAAKPADANQAPSAQIDREAILRRLTQVNSEYDQVRTLPGSPANRTAMATLLAEKMQLEEMLKDITAAPVGPDVGTPGRRAAAESPLMPRLHSTLGELARRTNTRIAVDLTVKDDPSPVGADSVTGLSVEQALRQILDATTKKYAFRVLPDNTYEVYYPLTSGYLSGTEITLALQDITQEVGVPIICDPNVALTTTASFENVPLETALEMMLSGTPYSFRRMENYYLVGDHGPDSQSFLRLAETRYKQLNHITPARVKELLSKKHAQYVQTESASTTDPNDVGHFVAVTAPADIADEIMAIIRRYDVPRRHVLLDARVVAMEHGNLLNLGVQWEFPTAEYGQLLTAGDWTKALSIGYSLDQTFTNALMAKINALKTNQQLEIVANPQLTAQDGSQAELRSIQEEWFMMTDTSTDSLYSRSELQKIESGTILTITPHIGDSNEITLEMAVEVSDSIAKGTDSDLPIINRRQAKNKITLQNGGTVAVAGLTENRTRKVNQRVPVLGSIPLVGHLFNNDSNTKTTREVAVFVTANLVSASSPVAMNPSGAPSISTPAQPAGQEFKNGLAQELANQSQ